MKAEPLTPAQVSTIDQNRAAARDDLNSLRVAFHAVQVRSSETLAVETLVTGILDDPDWDCLALAWALTEALALLSKPQPVQEDTMPIQRTANYALPAAKEALDAIGVELTDRDIEVAAKAMAPVFRMAALTEAAEALDAEAERVIEVSDREAIQRAAEVVRGLMPEGIES